MDDDREVIDVGKWPEKSISISKFRARPRLRAIIEGHLKRDTCRVGDHPPGEDQLRERFSVGRPTVRHALADPAAGLERLRVRSVRAEIGEAKLFKRYYRLTDVGRRVTSPRSGQSGHDGRVHHGEVVVNARWVIQYA